MRNILKDIEKLTQNISENNKERKGTEEKPVDVKDKMRHLTPRLQTSKNKWKKENGKEKIF